MKKQKMQSVNKLAIFIKSEYIEKPPMGAANIDIAIRDLLTDLLHVGDEYGVNIDHRLIDAKEVYEEETSNELHATTSFQDPA
jgi:hypothetical protein